jgi:hypothetical protein
MRSVADGLRRAVCKQVRRMTPDERIALTARLAGSDLQLFSAARRIPRAEARRLLIGMHQAGRRQSRVAEGIAE